MPDVDRGVRAVVAFWIAVLFLVVTEWISPLIGFGAVGALSGVVFVFAAWWGKQ